MTPEKAKEEWRPIPGWDGFYEVSDPGEARELAAWLNAAADYAEGKQ